MTCKQSGCIQPVYVRKARLCKNHYQMYRYRLYRPKLTLEDRFWKYVDKTSDCWLWVGAKNGGVYGHLKVGDGHLLAHRYSYELLVGPIPKGLQIDHLCFTPLCVNPQHLEPVTPRENCQRRSKHLQAMKRLVL